MIAKSGSLENGNLHPTVSGSALQPTRITDDIWFLDDALPQELLNCLLEYMRRLEDNTGQARLREIGSCNVSFWHAFSRQPAHIIEQVVLYLASYAELPDVCAGAEWWLNVRRSNEGMQGHFDKDESLLKRMRQIRCPERSSVFYLSDIGQPTLCTNYSLGDSLPLGPLDNSAPRVHVFVPPKTNRYLVFRGDLWHGSAKPLNTLIVKEDENKPRIVLAINWWTSKPEEPGCIELPERNAAQFYEFSSGQKLR